MYQKKFLLYLSLIIIALLGGAWFSLEFKGEPELIKEFTQPFLPEPIEQMNPSIALMSFFDLLMFSIIIISVLYASKFIAGERSQRTLQLIITRPVKRWKLLVGKYISFVIIFIPLLILSVILMTLWIEFIEIGQADKGVFIGYIAAALIYALVYTSIATLLSTISKNTATAALGSLIFLVGWVIIDFLITYMPEETAEIIEHGSLSHHANQVLGYISDGEAAIFAAGGIPADPNTEAFLYSVTIISLLIILPIIIAIVTLNKTEIH